RVRLAGLEADLLLRIAQEEAQPALEHVEGVPDPRVVVPRHLLARADLQLGDAEAGPLGVPRAALDLVEVAGVLHPFHSAPPPGRHALADGSPARMWEAWWWIRSHSSPLRSKMLVARTDVTEMLPRDSDRMFSVQVTQPNAPSTCTWTSVRLKRISWLFLKMTSQECRTASQPASRHQPGCTHRTWSSWAQISSIWLRSRVSKTR